MDTIHPDLAVFDEFLAGYHHGPFVMVNLLRFKRGGGSKAYSRYGSAMASLVPRWGGRFFYNGRVVQKFVGDDDWHAVALIEYPSRKAFVDLMRSPEYQAIHPFRDEGLEKTLVYATVPITVEPA